MKVSAKGRYAVRSVINLSLSINTQKSVREVATQESISSDFLEKIFRSLKKGGIIKSIRGAHGGFTLNKQPGDITVLEVLEAIGEEFNPTPCASDKCGKECDISYFWTMTREYVTDFFSKITIEDIIKREIKL
ncbi:Rrf2 family transcriptional regulator [Thiospirochaeta perfilievii]|uniref:Rrf2 family transcriptional regulator n=1 Tax=Thiospirochaeta perfilievii TaxID=252967 RepID=A0A5C1QD73_9SPIO|nr:Rrf2 family transcriptional regulator [Thiospirochaeta perfilievii]QEN05511.1 Rrf2 family transcriptional regulator [Thiospirochaeta perfilievii]